MSLINKTTYLGVIARVLSILIITISIVFLIGYAIEGLNKPIAKPLEVKTITAFVIWGLVYLGFAIAWVKEMLGGLISLIAFIGLYLITELVLNPGANFGLLFICPAISILFIMSALITRKNMG
jgi:hypothetical protein